jgi:hypothetical protein
MKRIEIVIKKKDDESSQQNIEREIQRGKPHVHERALGRVIMLIMDVGKNNLRADEDGVKWSSKNEKKRFSGEITHETNLRFRMYNVRITMYDLRYETGKKSAFSNPHNTISADLCNSCNPCFTSNTYIHK